MKSLHKRCSFTFESRTDFKINSFWEISARRVYRTGNYLFLFSCFHCCRLQKQLYQIGYDGPPRAQIQRMILFSLNVIGNVWGIKLKNLKLSWNLRELSAGRPNYKHSLIFIHHRRRCRHTCLTSMLLIIPLYILHSARGTLFQLQISSRTSLCVESLRAKTRLFLCWSSSHTDKKMDLPHSKNSRLVLNMKT